MVADSSKIWQDRYLTTGSDLNFLGHGGLDRLMILKDLLAAWMRAWFVRDKREELSSADVESVREEKRDGRETARMLEYLGILS